MSQKPRDKDKTKEKPDLNTLATKRQRTSPAAKKKTPPSPTAPPTSSATVEIVPEKRVKHPNSGKKPGCLSAKTKKAVELCLTTGISPKDAYTLANGKPPTPASATRLKQMVEKYSLQRPVMQKLANQAIKDTLEGREARYNAVKVFSNGKKVPYQEVIVPSYTNKLAAAAMVYDRIDPIVTRSENLNINVDCSPVDLSKYRNR